MRATTDPADSLIPAMSLDSPSDNAMTALYRVALGPVNRDYYLPIFARFDDTGRTTTSWNWAASLCTLNWMVFRQVWSGALVYVAAAEGLALLVFALGRQFLHWPQGVELGVLAAFALLAFAVPGLYGNALLHADLRRRIARALAASRTVPEACALLDQRASTRKRLHRLIAANVALAVVAVAAYLALPRSGFQGSADTSMAPAVTVAQAASAAAATASAPADPPSPTVAAPPLDEDTPPSPPPPASSAPVMVAAPRAAPTASATSAAPPSPVAVASAPAAAGSRAPASAPPTPAAKLPASAPAAAPGGKAAPAPEKPAQGKADSSSPGNPEKASTRPAAKAEAPASKPAAPASKADTPPAKPASKPAATAERAPRAPKATPPAMADAAASAASESASAPPPTVGSTAGYYINVGLFADEANARKAQARLLNEGLPAFRQELNNAKGRRIRVRVGPYASRAQADAAADSIRAMALEAVVFKQ